MEAGSPHSFVWAFLDVDGNPMSCKAPSCSYKRVFKNFTHARRHLLSCVLAAELYPKLQERLAPTARDGSVEVI